MEYLEWIAAGANLVAGVVCATRYAKARNNGTLFLSGCFLLAGAIFTYLATT